MILLDTSVLIDALTGGRRSAPALRRTIESGERVALTTLVLYEWHRGPRRNDVTRLRRVPLASVAAELCPELPQVMIEMLVHQY